MARVYEGEVISKEVTPAGQEGGGVRRYTGDVIPLSGGGAAHGASPAQPPLPEQSMTGFIAGNLNKGIANTLGMPVDAVTNALNLGIAGVGSLAGARAQQLGAQPHPPGVIERPFGGSQWWQDMGARAGLIGPSAEPQSGIQRYAATALQFGPAALLGRPSPAQIPRALGATTTSAVGSEATRDVLGDEWAGVGAMAPGALSMQHRARGERATEARQARDFGKARELGIPIPPRDLKTDKSQQAIQNAANKDLRMPEGTEFTPQGMQNFRNAHYDDYLGVIREPGLQGTIQTTPKFQSAIKKIAQDERALRTEFPNATKDVGLQEVLADFTKPTFTAEGAMNQVQRLRQSANNNLSAASANDDTIRMGLIQRRIATAMEDLIGENVQRIGKPELVKKWQEARTQIAKSHDIEAALEPGGKINPKKLAALQNDTVPISGQIKALSDVSGAFPGAVKGSVGQHDEFFTKRVTPMAIAHPQAAGVHWATRMWDPLTQSGPAQRFFVDPASRLTPEQQQMIRYFSAINAQNRANQVPTPPE